MRINEWRYVGWLLILFVLTGCVNNSVQTKHPSANLSQIKSVYVQKLEADGRGVNHMICNQLIALGYEASTGISQPDKVDAVLVYADRWRWDMTMYMLSLNIKLIHPDTDFPLASGQVLHTSLTRRTPQAMVREVLHNVMLQ